MEDEMFLSLKANAESKTWFWIAMASSVYLGVFLVLTDHTDVIGHSTIKLLAVAVIIPIILLAHSFAEIKRDLNKRALYAGLFLLVSFASAAATEGVVQIVKYLYL